MNLSGTPQAAPHAAEPTTGPLTWEELELASRNHALPLEALAFDHTPAGLHYLVTHFDIPVVDDPDQWRLRIGGAVRNRLTLTLDDLRARPAVEHAVTLECAGNGRAQLRPRPVSVPWLHGAVGTAVWTGTPLGPVLDEAGVEPAAEELVFTGADRGVQGGEHQAYARSLPLAEAMAPGVMLAYAMNGQPLPPQHGHPLRLVVPGWYGMASVKWLSRVDVVTTPFEGFQQLTAYRYQQAADDPGEPVTRVRVRSLMTPPGSPDFSTRARTLSPGRTELTGRAWSGEAAVERVEVAVDGTWAEARLDPPVGPLGWCRWSYVWDAPAGTHELACRATDAAGVSQPLETVWNYQGMGNNAVQRITVRVDDGGR